MNRLTRNIVIVLLATSTLTASAREVREIFRGKKLSEEQLGTKTTERFMDAWFSGVIDGDLTFLVTVKERRVTSIRPIYEKVRITRENSDPTDSGVREVLVGQTVKGDVEERQRVVDLGPVKYTAFSYLGTTQRTDVNGLLTDKEQTILKQFDNLDFDQLSVEATAKSGTIQLKLTRERLYEKYDVQFGFKGQTTPVNLKTTAEWDRSQYAAGDAATLVVTAENAGESGDLVLLRGGRSVSRWDWLDGQMFYFGHLAPNDKRTFVRQFIIPKDAKPGYYHLRVGFSERSGEKPQLPLYIRVK
jgi:hypothetical protein